MGRFELDWTIIEGYWLHWLKGKLFKINEISMGVAGTANGDLLNIPIAGGLFTIIIMETVHFLTDRNVPNRNRSNNHNKTTNRGA